MLNDAKSGKVYYRVVRLTTTFKFGVVELNNCMASCTARPQQVRNAG